MITNTTSAFNQGWMVGYNDGLSECPYPSDSEEYVEWFSGYHQGLYAYLHSIDLDD